MFAPICMIHIHFLYFLVLYSNCSVRSLIPEPEYFSINLLQNGWLNIFDCLLQRSLRSIISFGGSQSRHNVYIMYCKSPVQSPWDRKIASRHGEHCVFLTPSSISRGIFHYVSSGNIKAKSWAMQLLPSIIHKFTTEHTEMADRLVGRLLRQFCSVGSNYLIWWSHSDSLKQIHYLASCFYTSCLLQLCCLLPLSLRMLPLTISPSVLLTCPLYPIRKHLKINVVTRF